tara:strand:+ start:170 stop:580 length:411 start_codon:yes stop_codon:yes gene_type:complete
MQFNIQPLKHTDYEEFLCDWWKDWRWTPPQKNFLPENGTGGYMIYVDDTPVVAGFLYNTNSDVAWVDFIISNFNYKHKENRLIAIDMLLKSLEQRAVAINKKFLYALTKHKNLIASYEANGYIGAGVYNVELIKKL